MVIWEHNFWKGGKNKFTGSGDSFLSPGLPRVWQIPLYFDFRVPSAERGVERDLCVCVCGFALFFVCVVFYSLLVLTIFTIASAFHCRVNDRQLWKEVAMTCDFGIHGLEHYTPLIKGL